MEAKQVIENLEAIRARIAKACRAAGRSSSEVTLLAVSKRQPTDRLLAAYEAGQRDFGENYVQALEVRNTELPDKARWHMVGHLQSNKAKLAARISHFVHTVDSKTVANELAKGADRPISVFLQVNISREATKSGLAAGDVEELLNHMRRFDSLRVAGLMAIPTVGQGRRWFAELRQLRDSLSKSTGIELPGLSMGMSSDFEDAILEGSTCVRVGEAIFGTRPPSLIT